MVGKLKGVCQNMWNIFTSELWNHTCINGEFVLGFLGAEGECCAWWNQRKMMPNSRSWENLNTCWVSKIIPECWVMEEEVCAENLLLLQIDVQGRLNHETEVWSAFRSNKITRIQDLTFWRRRGKVDQGICLECCYCRRLAWGFLFLTSCHFSVRYWAYRPAEHNWLAGHFCWLLGGSDHHPARS